MPYYSDELVEEVRSRSDIVDVINGYVHLEKKGRDYFGLCPFHNEKSPSFSVSPYKQMYYCFGCGAGGNVFSFLMKYENYTFGEAMQTLADRAGIELPKQELSEEKKREADKRQRLLEVNREAAVYFFKLLRHERGKRAYEYFKGRGLTDETMQKFGLGYSDQYSDDLYRYLKSKGYDDALLKDSGLVGFDEKRGMHDKFWNRAMFPIQNIHNKVIGFGGRVMGDGEPKYLNSQETMIFEKSRNLYGLHIARGSRKDQLILCEGYMDVIALHQAGFDNAVASLGTAFTAGHANLLRRYTKAVYLSYDSDGAGVKAALRAIPILKDAGITAKVINMRPYKDPDEFIKALGPEEYGKRIAEAENSFLFEIRILYEQHDMEDPQSKTDFYNETAKRLVGFTEAEEREIYMEVVAKKYGFGLDNLRKKVNSLGLSAGAERPQRTTEPEERQRGGREKGNRESGAITSQKMLLTWLIEEVSLFPKIMPYISPEDFTEELYKRLAELLFKQYEQTQTVTPAQLISAFEDEEEQRLIAECFHTKLRGGETKSDRETALKQIIIKVKENSCKYHSMQADGNDAEAMKRALSDMQALQELQKLHISVD